MKKLLLLLIALLSINISSFAQAPEKFKYQAIITDNKDFPVRNKTIGLQISVLQNDLNGTIVYQETFTARTNNSGLVNLEIGTGNITSGIFSDINWGVGPFFLGIAIDTKGGTNYINMGASQLLSVPYALYAKYAENMEGGDNDPTNEIELPETANENDILTFNGTAWVALANPDGDPTNEIELPEVNGSEGQVLTTNGEGVVSWQTPVEAAQNLSTVLTEGNDGGANQIKNIADPTDAQDAATKAYVDALDATLASMAARIATLESGGPTGPIQIGDNYQGGIVFYIFQFGDEDYVQYETHGLIAAPTDQSTGIQWYNGSFPGSVVGTTGTALGTGQANTLKIVNVLGAGSYAAMLCANYDDGIYTDWFLPSTDELNLMYLNIGPGAVGPNNNIGGFSVALADSGVYYSSSEANQGEAWTQFFATGSRSITIKDIPSAVRAIRYF
ncbi:MAG: hypothetical protein WBM98_14410 [Maribacter sp.]|uniref:hypothetical protein n=1 Tax=Maribacter sp. TaxID=1897614 RepID=UPI003C71BF2A